jgi:RRXRR protein
MVYVLDKRKKPLMPCSHKRAPQFLERGRARVHKRFPFTIRRVDRLQQDSVLQPLTLKIDPGSKTTGIALVREAGPRAEVVSLIELEHRGQAIKKKLKQRAAFRRRRRSANLRYRAPRFNNRRRKKGWLPPSLQHRVDTTLSRREQVPLPGSCHCHRPGTCPLRHAADREPGDLWSPVPARNSCRLLLPATKFGSTCSRNGVAKVSTAMRSMCPSIWITFSLAQTTDRIERPTWPRPERRGLRASTRMKENRSYRHARWR